MALSMSFKIDHDATETLAAETIEWPFLKAQRDGGDPEVSTAAASDGDSTRPSSEGPSNNGSGSHYEIVVSNHDVPPSTTFSTAADQNNQFEACLISNADLAALATNGVDPSVKLEGNDGRIHYSASDAVHYFDPEATLASVDSEEQQRLIKVYQTAMESGDNKLITVYEIKPDDEGGGFHPLDGGNPSGQASSGAPGATHNDGRDVMVEIVHDEDQLLRSVTEDGTLVLPASISASSLNTSSLVTLPHSFVTSPPAAVSELRCQLCGFISFAREEMAEHCLTSHDLFFCQTCNLVFKRKQNLLAHAKSKHGQVLAHTGSSSPNCSSIVTNAGLSLSNSRTVLTGSKGNRAAGRVNKRRGANSLSSASISHMANQRRSLGSLTASSSSSSSSSGHVGGALSHSPLTNATSIEMSDIKDILAKNKAVLPILSQSSSPGALTSATTFPTSSSRQRGSGCNSSSTGSKRGGGRRSSAHDWARVGSLTAQHQQQLMLDSRLNDPQTRLQFNQEFAKKITSHGIGAEVLGLSEERLPAKKGTFRLDIKERVLENGEPQEVGTAKRDSASGALPDNLDLYYSYDIIDTKEVAPDGGCLVVCGICEFSNARIENVLFHCEIDHKQYYCHNKRCQNGFSSWDSLMRHMKTVHKKEK